MVKPFKSSAEMRECLKKWEPSWGNKLSTLAVIYACERLEELALLLRKPASRKRNSEWVKFFAKGMKAGKSPAQIGKEWAEKKYFPKPSKKVR